MKKIWIILFAIAIVVAIIAGTYALNDVHKTGNNTTAVSATALPPSAQQKEEAIAIATSDEYVAEKLGNAAYLAPDHNLTHHLSGAVIMYSYIDRSPGANNMTVVEPAVEYILGNESDAGANMYAFVDLQKNRVTYIGFTPREGNNAYNYTYKSYSDGVEGVEVTIPTIGWDTMSYLTNATIVDTGYDRRSYSEQEAIDIAINNSTVKSYLDGRKYAVNAIGIAESEGGGYMAMYPVMRIVIFKEDGSMPDFYLSVGVNLKSKKVNLFKTDWPMNNSPGCPL
jgi:hypothetical protein